MATTRSGTRRRRCRSRGWEVCQGYWYWVRVYLVLQPGQKGMHRFCSVHEKPAPLGLVGRALGCDPTSAAHGELGWPCAVTSVRVETVKAIVGVGGSHSCDGGPGELDLRGAVEGTRPPPIVFCTHPLCLVGGEGSVSEPEGRLELVHALRQGCDVEAGLGRLHSCCEALVEGQLDAGDVRS